MPRRWDVLSVIETAYRLDGSTDAWLESMLAALTRVLDAEPVGLAQLYDATAADWVHLSCLVNRGVPEQLLAEALNFGDRTDGRARALVELYRAGTFAPVLEVMAPVAPFYPSLFARFGIEDAVTLIVPDPTARGCMFAIANRKLTVSARTRYFWRKASAHIAAGYRLRCRLESVNGDDGWAPTAHAEAILSSTGTVEHAVGPAKEAAAREALRDGLARIDASRGGAARDDRERTLELWQGLVAGRWSLVEHFEKDGRRYFLAYRNAPELAPHRALTNVERLVVAYEAMGWSNKLMAYSLGLSKAAVVRHLHRAHLKLGGASMRAAVQQLLRLQDGAERSSPQ